MMFLLMIASTVLSTPQVIGQPSQDTVDLQTLMEDYYIWCLKEYPERATSFGVNQWNNKRQSFNLTVYPRRKAEADHYFSRLMDINCTDLSEENKVNYDILHDELKTYIDGYAWYRYGTLNPLGFLGEERRMLRSFPLITEKDFEEYIGRLTKTKVQLEEYRQLYREAIRLGRTLNAVSINPVAGQIEDLLVDNATQSIYYSIFNWALERSTTLSNTRKHELSRRTVTVIEKDVLTPYRDFKKFLEAEYIPATRTALGVGSWDDGQAYYRACLKWHLSQNVTAEEIHKMGLDEVERISTQMIKLMHRRGFAGTISEYFEYLKTDPAFHSLSTEDILQGYRNIIFERINPHLYKFFKNFPDVPVIVRVSAVEGNPLAYYEIGSNDGFRPGIFWANVFRPNETYSFAMASVAAHETNPGHHLHYSYALRIGAPPFRTHSFTTGYSIPFAFPAYTATTEGWALYAEALAEEMGLYKDDFELMGRYSWEMFRACRMVVDTGLHAFNWSREKVLQYLQNYTHVSRTQIENEINRYITEPGQACAYKFGELKLWELRKKAELSLGEKFDIKEFHSAILDWGIVPLNIADKAVEGMIKRIQETVTSDSNIIQSWQFFSLIVIVLVRQLLK